LDIKLLWVPY